MERVNRNYTLKTKKLEAQRQKNEMLTMTQVMKSKPEISPYSRELAGRVQKIHERYSDVIQTKTKKMDALKLELQKKIEAQENATFAPNLSARAPLKGESMGLNDS